MLQSLLIFLNLLILLFMLINITLYIYHPINLRTYTYTSFFNLQAIKSKMRRIRKALV